MLDLYGCDIRSLGDFEVCYKFLDELPQKIGMEVLTPPYLVIADSNESAGGKDPGGLTGYTIIAESHISIHTFVKRKFVSLDVYSCKDFDVELVEKYIHQIFKPADVEKNLVQRGTKYPTGNII